MDSKTRQTQSSLFSGGRGPLLLIFWILLFTSGAASQEETRGVGVYPGNPREEFSPTTQIDSVHYRNLALHRAAYQSDCYDFNLTAQLVTDGIVDTTLPGWIVTSTGDEGVLKRNEREWILDRHPMTRKTLEGSVAWLRVDLGGNSAVPEIDSLSVSGSLLTDSLPAKHWEITVRGTSDNVHWQSLGAWKGDGLPGDTMTGFFRMFYPQNLRVFSYPIRLDSAVHCRSYRIDVNSPNARSWSIAELGMFRRGTHAVLGGPYHFVSAWKSADSAEAWVSVDLGARCSFDRVVLHWIRPAAAGSIEVSDDDRAWTVFAPLRKNTAGTEIVKLGKEIRGRYVRILMTRPASADGYILSELEVYGRGGPVPVPHPSAAGKSAGRMDLAGGAWKLQRASLVHEGGERLSTAEYDDSTWMVATVPGTALVSYLNDGALPDPNFGDNQLLISDAFFYSDFWYRDKFTLPASFEGKRQFLNFDGINWKAEVFLNGKALGTIAGAFTRRHFDVTGILRPGQGNTLAVLILKNDAPGFVKEQTRLSHDANGGELGADNPTFHASVGWDWIPTIRGRNTGIWNNVYLSATGPVTLEDPLVSPHLLLPDTSRAEIRLAVTLRNRVAEEIDGTLRGSFGAATFSRAVSLKPLESKTVFLDPSTDPSLNIRHPKLWWPNGYGAQHLYDVKFEFVTSDGRQSDAAVLKTGIREMSYSAGNGALKIWINGRRFIARGGNWGFSESNLRYRAREYDAAVRYHKDMHFTMIRNWVGQTGDDAFFDACDRYGIVVWQDFWLANPLDGPNPEDDSLFLRNADDFIRRIRNHPSIGLYCGRNEGNPPAAIDSALKLMLPQLHPGIQYISNSAFGVVSGGGPYRAMPVKFYFDKRATEKLHSEIGMPNMVSYESLRRMLPDSALWPIGRLWGVHDFNLESAQHGYSFLQLLSDAFGPVPDLRKWLALAQWVNGEGYRAMFEAQSKHRMGLLLWMSHPAWPSMVWQTYDYYFEPTAAYFGCKRACEPLHIQWNPLSDSIEVVNYSVPDGSGLTALAEILNLDGSVKWRKQVDVDCPEDSTVSCFGVEHPAGSSSAYLLRLRLMRGVASVSENSYWRGVEEGNLKALSSLPPVKLKTETTRTTNGDLWHLTTRLTNSSNYPAFLVRLKIMGGKGKRILPVVYSDNYLTLMPGEQRTVNMEVKVEDARGRRPGVIVEGYNVW